MSSSVAPSARACCRLEHLGLGAVVAVREADGRPDGDVGAGEDGLGARDVRRPDAHARDVVLGRQPAAVLDERVVELGTQQRVVDRLRDVPFGQRISR